MTTPEVLTLMQMRAVVANLPDDDRIRTEAIATTIRGILQLGGSHATMALALVGAELAAGVA